ncbi:MAG TPA: hypothetical protein VN441_13900, partial [Syntrophomonas sp.]|nr:hypothetical protein [Syntrophomonas sp.]
MSDHDSKVLESFLNTPASGRILSKDMGKFIENCYADDIPPCTSACPLGFDVIPFIKKMQKDNMNSAYTMYRDQVLFPAIVCRLCDQPCDKACVRKDIDDSLAMKLLEKAAIDYARSATPIKYNVPKKNKKIAIVGAGLCGLSCTVKLASHG